MTGLLDLFERTITDSWLGSTTPLTQARVLGWGLMALAAGLAVFGLGFGLYGAYRSFELSYSPPQAIVATGLLSLALGLFILAILGLTAYIRQQQMARARVSLTKRLSLGMDTLEDEFGESIRANPKLSLLLSSVAGFIIEERVS